MSQRTVLTAISYFSLGLLTVTGGFVQGGYAQSSPADAQAPTYAPQQQQDQQPHAWRRADAPPDPAQQAPDQGPPPPPPNYSANQDFGQAPAQQNAPPQNAPPQNAPAPNMAPPPQAGNQPMPPQYQQAPPNQQPPQYQQQPQYQQNDSIPARLTIKPGTFVTVRVNQWLSSDRNQQGDVFFGSLAEPIIVDGIVVAQRGQPVSGRVTEAQKAGRVEGTSKLGVELTSLTMVDGQQMPIQSQMITRNGNTSVGRDVGAVAGTTALGAAIGAGADWGRGAAIGAGAGAAAGIIGVLLTRGHPTVIYPETALTFRINSAVTVATDRAPQAFRYVDTRDYGNPGYAQRPAPRLAGPVGPAPLPYYYGPAYYPYYPYYYGGLGLSLYVGPRYYGYYGGFGYRGFRR